MTLDPALEQRWDELHEALVGLAAVHAWHARSSDEPPCRSCDEARRAGRKLDRATEDVKRQMRMASSSAAQQNTVAQAGAAGVGGGEDLQIVGTLIEIRFRRDSFAIMTARTEQEAVTVKGSCLSPQIGATYTFRGKWSTHPKWGKSFDFSSYDVSLPTTSEAVQRYLMATARWMGAVTARDVWDRYGAETMEVLKREPERVARDVRGITLDRALDIQKSLVGNERLERVTIGLTTILDGSGMGQAAINRAIERWGHEALAVVKDDPFRLVELRGIGFPSADRVRANLGIAMEDPKRIRSGILHALDEAANGGGHTFMSDSAFREATKRLLFLVAAQVEPVMHEMVKAGELVVEETDFMGFAGWNVALAPLYRAEKSVAEHLVAMVARGDVTLPDNAAEVDASGLHDDQAEALVRARRARVFVLTGAPGTGKTFLVKRMIEMLHADGCVKVALAAPTGKAAKRMMEQTGCEASTIHRLLEPSAPDGGSWEFARNAENQLDVDAVVLDECSMIDVCLMRDFLAALPLSARLVIVGDTNQLPSVGAGNVLSDIIKSGVVEVAELRTIKRQDAGNIVRHLHRIRDGQNLGDLVAQNQSSPDFFWAECTDEVEALECIVSLVSERLPARFGVEPVRDIQVISPLRERGLLSCKSINERLQAVLNENRPAPGNRFALGDKVIQTRNDYSKGIYNGDIGIVTGVNVRDRKYEVQFDAPTRDVEIPFNELEMEHAYAITIHKSQGSEWPVVVIPVHASHGPNMLQRNLLYTAISRARTVCICVGQSGEVPKIIKRVGQANRSTSLRKLLRAAAAACGGASGNVDRAAGPAGAAEAGA